MNVLTLTDTAIQSKQSIVIIKKGQWKTMEQFKQNTEPFFSSLGFIWIFIFLICVSIVIQYFFEQDHNNKVKQEIKIEQEKAKFI
jgi:hypothetical protein